jgi:RimJ/RimL family protein N-acetyltransferase
MCGMSRAVILEPFDPDRDAERLIGWLDSPELVARWAGSSRTHPVTRAQLDPLDGEVPWRVVDAHARAVIGHIELVRLDEAARSGHLARVLIGDPAARGRGLGQAAVRAALAHAFGELRLERVTLNVFATNDAAIGAYERAGFVRERLLPRSFRFGDEQWDMWLMAARRR